MTCCSVRVQLIQMETLAFIAPPRISDVKEIDYSRKFRDEYRNVCINHVSTMQATLNSALLTQGSITKERQRSC